MLETKKMKAMSLLETAATMAGHIMKQYFAEPGLVASTLKADMSPVTEADIQIDAKVASLILREFPDAGIVREEGKNINFDARERFTIDGIDGTGAFSRGNTGCAFAASFEVDGVVEVSVIYAPLYPTPLRFTAVRETGVYLNGRRLWVSLSHRPRIEIATIPGMKLQSFAIARELDATGFMVGEVTSISLSAALVAAGVIDGVIFPGTSEWDIYPGDLMVREAGGRTSDLHGKPIDCRSGKIDGMLASSEAIHEVLVKIVENNR